MKDMSSICVNCTATVCWKINLKSGKNWFPTGNMFVAVVGGWPTVPIIFVILKSYDFVRVLLLDW